MTASPGFNNLSQYVSFCARCGNTVTIRHADAWPQRCPHCHATPFCSSTWTSLSTATSAGANR